MLTRSLSKIAIIVLNWNGKQDTITCLGSLNAIIFPHFEIILVDNGSTDGSVELIKERFPHVHCIETGKNLGFAGGNNVGIAYALEHKADYVLLLNNDTYVPPDLLDAFMEGFADHPSAGILGARIYLFDKRNTLDHLGGNWVKDKAKVDLVGWRAPETEPPSEYIPLDYVCGACMMIKRSVFETIGMLEPRYFLYWEENDFCLRAKKAGFDILSSPKAKIWHKVSASIVGGRAHAAYFIARGRLLWISRHYSAPEKRALYLKEILPEILKLIKINVLKTEQLDPLRNFKKYKQKSK